MPPVAAYVNWFMSLKRTIRAFLPAPLLSAYHWLTSWLVALYFGLPGRKLVIIGVTGTKGKTTTASMLWYLLEKAGKKTALLTTAFFAIGEETWLNDLKMTMPGRVKLNEFLRRASRANCEYVIIETSSEGLAQWRHLGLFYKFGIFTNLTPEHLEAHGNFIKYRQAKARLFNMVSKNNGVAIINLDDKEADYFIKHSGKKVCGYTFNSSTVNEASKIISAKIINSGRFNVEFTVDNIKVNIPVGGKMNAYNALACITAANSLGVSLTESARLLSSYPGTPGRLEFVQSSPFAVVVDYAHTAESLEELYKTLKGSGKLIAVLGSCGGGRDKVKRVPLGRIAGKYADYVIVTNEDPYDESPRTIMETVASGVKASGKKENDSYWIIEDRRKAIIKAIALAKQNDVVAITGKGAEQWMCVSDNKKIPWDDRNIVKEELNNLSDHS